MLAPCRDVPREGRPRPSEGCVRENPCPAGSHGGGLRRVGGDRLLRLGVDDRHPHVQEHDAGRATCCSSASPAAPSSAVTTQQPSNSSASRTTSRITSSSSITSTKP